MVKYIVIMVIVILASFYFILPISANPIIEIPDQEYNFGELLPGQIVHHTYIVKNKGTTDLIISEISPSCGCTTALLLEKIVPPGKSVKIEADLTAQLTDGVIRKNITVVSNDPKNPTVIIYLNATVKSDFLLEPKNIDIGEMFIGDRKEFKFTVKPVNKKPFEPSQVIYSKESFTVAYKPLTPDDPLSTYEFTVEFFATAKLKPRNAYENITIFPYKENKILNVIMPFSGKILGYVQQSAGSIFRKAEKGKGYKEIVNFKHLKDKSFNIISASSSNENVTTNIIKISESKYDVEITLKEGIILKKDGKESKKEDVAIVVKTDQEDSKEMNVFITFLIVK